MDVRVIKNTTNNKYKEQIMITINIADLIVAGTLASVMSVMLMAYLIGLIISNRKRNEESIEEG
jgi:hypothetical protein